MFCVSLISMQDRANTLFKQVNDSRSLKGRSNDAIASACLYLACRQEGVPRTFKGEVIWYKHAMKKLILLYDSYEQGQIDSRTDADGWAGAVKQKPLESKKCGKPTD